MREVHSVASAITKQTVVWTGEQLYIGWSGKASWRRGCSSWEWKMTRASHVKTGGKEFQAQGRVQANVWDQRNPNVAEMRDQCQSKERDTYAKYWWSFPRKTSLESLPLPPVPPPLENATLLRDFSLWLPACPLWFGSKMTALCWGKVVCLYSNHWHLIVC